MVVVASVLSQRDLMRIGLVLIALPLLAAALVARTRFRLAMTRGLQPSRVQAGETTTAVIRLENLSRLAHGLLLVEDSVPWELGQNQRRVMTKIDPGKRHHIRYELVGTVRGRYEIGPLNVNFVDPFGLCRVQRDFTTTDTLTVVPTVVSLPAIPLAGDWNGAGESRARSMAATGDDDVIPREYHLGDDLRRVHWKSTARSGELMVRREEQPWRAQATIVLDTRAGAHHGAGQHSSFEWAVTAVASIACHLISRGYGIRLVDIDGNALRATASVPEMLSGLDSVGVLLDCCATAAFTPGLTPAIAHTARWGQRSDGLFIAVLGELALPDADTIARLRTGHGSGFALLLNTSSWSQIQYPDDARLKGAAALLTAAGWRVAVCEPDIDLGTSWRALAQAGVTAGGAR